MKKTAARTHITLESFIQSSVVRLVLRCGTLFFTCAIELPEGKFCM
jgi:hypothetical protein